MHILPAKFNVTHMQTNHIVLAFPTADYLPRLLEIVESVQIKTFIPKLPIEAFNEAVLHGFPGIDKHMLYMLLVDPNIESVTGKFETVVKKIFYWPAVEQAILLFTNFLFMLPFFHLSY